MKIFRFIEIQPILKMLSDINKEIKLIAIKLYYANSEIEHLYSVHVISISPQIYI